MELGLLILRFAVGATMAAHGAQKLLPSERGGMGIGAVAGLVDDLGFRPARPYAWALTLAELLGGLALVLGFGTPMAAAAVIAVLVAAIGAVHLDKGFFAQHGGFELPMVLALGALALAMTGPGEWSVDHALSWDLDGDAWSIGALLTGMGAGLLALSTRRLGALRLRGRAAAHA